MSFNYDLEGEPININMFDRQFLMSAIDKKPFICKDTESLLTLYCMIKNNSLDNFLTFDSISQEDKYRLLLTCIQDMYKDFRRRLMNMMEYYQYGVSNFHRHLPKNEKVQKYEISVILGSFGEMSLELLFANFLKLISSTSFEEMYEYRSLVVIKSFLTYPNIKEDMELTSNTRRKGIFTSIYSRWYNGRPHLIRYYDHMEDWTDKDICKIRNAATTESLISHPNINKFVLLNDNQGTVLVERGLATLGEVIYENSLNIQPEELRRIKLSWVYQIVHAFFYLYSHCSLSVKGIHSNNFIVFQENGKLILKLQDFLVSTCCGAYSTLGVNAHDSKHGERTTKYFPPELIDYKDLPIYNEKTTVYSCAVLINEMFSGPSFTDKTLKQLEKLIVQGGRPQPFTPQNNLEERILDILGDVNCGCFAQDPNLRPSLSTLHHSFLSLGLNNI